MNTILRRRLAATLTTAVLALGAASASRATADAPPIRTASAPRANPMHPAFVPLDAEGAPARATGRPYSSERTCGGCHDVPSIQAHSDHWTERAQVDCVACHFAGGSLPKEVEAYESDGRLRRAALRISAPSNEACAACHALVQRGHDPLMVPTDFGRAQAPGRTDALTLETGEVLSGQNLSESFLNLREKERRTYPWDAHLRRMVTCVDCHYARNNPQKAEMKRARPDFLAEDPRRLDLADYLKQPDHRLVAAGCRTCHDPSQAHEFLPYRARHLAALDCRACHVPEVMGPAARLIDSTVVTADAAPAIFLRGTEARPGDPLNAAYLEGYTPILRATPDTSGREFLSPYNAVATYAWRDAEGRSVPWSIVVAAFREGDDYAPEIVQALDGDGDRRLGPDELRLDRPEKATVVQARLMALGVNGPEPVSTVRYYPVRHGIQSGQQVLRDCNSCHTAAGRWSRPLEMAPYALAGLPLLSAAEPTAPRSRHIFGHARGGWIDRVGFLLFLAVVAGVVVHGGLRLRLSGARPETEGRRQRVYLYSRYERIWHWLMAGSVLVLAVTGLQIHFAGGRGGLALPRAVAVHNAFALLLTVNGFLSLFYHVTTSAIRRYFVSRDRMLAGILEQARFYTSGIFLGRPHPSPKTPERRLNPLQQVTYLVLLNLLFPLQVVTGILIWGASRWPGLADRLGGLTVVAPIHNLGAWCFLAFLVLHLYLITIGHTVLANVRAMVSGYDEIESDHLVRRGGSHA